MCEHELCVSEVWIEHTHFVLSGSTCRSCELSRIRIQMCANSQSIFLMQQCKATRWPNISSSCSEVSTEPVSCFVENSKPIWKTTQLHGNIIWLWKWSWSACLFGDRHPMQTKMILHLNTSLSLWVPRLQLLSIFSQVFHPHTNMCLCTLEKTWHYTI